MPTILLVADSPWVRNDVRAALSDPDYEIEESDDPATVTETIAKIEPDAVVVDLQVRSMGGMAIVRAIKDAAAVDGIAEVPAVLLLDRRADAFLAKRAAADAWVQKPFTPHQLREALTAAVGKVARRAE